MVKQFISAVVTIIDGGPFKGYFMRCGFCENSRINPECDRKINEYDKENFDNYD